MLTISVQSDLMKAMAQLRSITEAQQLRFAAAKALTTTAKQAQTEVKGNLPKRFTIRRPWVVQGIKITAATKADLTATVFSRDKFMGLQEAGGAKGPLRNYIAIPTSAVRRTARDIIRAQDRPKALGDKATIVEFRGHKYLALKKARKGANKGGQLRLLYLLVPRAQIKSRLGLAADSMRIARANFGANLRAALDEAVKSAR